MSGHTHNGDIMTEFGLAVSGDEDKTVSGKIGGGTARIVLNTSNADLNIKKGSAFPAAPPAPPAAASAPKTPKAPAAPNAPHLKSSKTLPQQPVTQ